MHVPPHNLDAERAVLGSCLIDREAIDVVDSILTDGPADFYSTPHRHIWGAITSLAESGKPVDLMTVYDQLTHVEQVEEIGGLSYLSSLEQYVMTTANVSHHAEIVHEYARQRDDLAAAANFLEAAVSANGQFAEARGHLLQHFAEKDDDAKTEYLALKAYLNAETDFPDSEPLWSGDLEMTGTISLLSGKTGIRKTFFALQKAMQHASGTDFLGRETAPAVVAYLQSELSDRILISKRLRPMLDALATDLSNEQSETLHRNLIFQTYGAEVTLYSTPPRYSSSFSSTTEAGRHLRRVENLIKTRGVRYVILDPVSDLLPFNEIDGADIAQALRPLKRLSGRYGVSWLLVHHFNKTAYRGTVPLDAATRGHTKLRDTVSLAMELSPAEDTLAKTHAVLTFSKHRHAARTPEPMLLRCPTPEFPFFDVDESQDIQRSQRQTPGRQQVLDILNAEPGLRYKELCDRLVAEYDCGKRTAARWIKTHRETGTIRYDSATFRHYSTEGD